ncbi:MAG: DUF4917 family protein [Dehalococcoidia bacterium]
MDLLTYHQVLELLPPTKHLLLGNGFSISCDPAFRYDSLYEFAREHGLSRRAQAVFEKIGTSNFEGVLRALGDTEWIAATYGLAAGSANGGPSIAEDIESVKNALVAAVAQRHLERPSDVDEAKRAAAVEFLSPYHNVFTTNYDLLLYWITMQGNDEHADLARRDGFRADPEDPEAPHLLFQEHVGGDRGFFFVHGALHLYVHHGQVRKHSWIRSGIALVDLIREALDKYQYPLFVAEGDAHTKLEQIQRSGYLSYGLGKLERIQKALVTFGLAFGESDAHIAHVIADNPKLEHVYIGLFDGPDSPAGQAVLAAADRIDRRRRANRTPRGDQYPGLAIQFYDAKSARPWG